MVEKSYIFLLKNGYFFGKKIFYFWLNILVIFLGKNNYIFGLLYFCQLYFWSLYFWSLYFWWFILLALYFPRSSEIPFVGSPLKLYYSSKKTFSCLIYQKKYSSFLWNIKIKQKRPDVLFHYEIILPVFCLILLFYCVRNANYITSCVVEAPQPQPNYVEMFL